MFYRQFYDCIKPVYSILLIWFFDVCWCNLNIVLVVKFIRRLLVFGLY